MNSDELLLVHAVVVIAVHTIKQCTAALFQEVELLADLRKLKPDAIAVHIHLPCHEHGQVHAIAAEGLQVAR